MKGSKDRTDPKFQQASIEGQSLAGRRKDGWKWRQLVGSQLLPSADHASPSQHQLPPKRKCTSKYKIQMKIVLSRPHPFDCTVLIQLFDINNCKYSYENTRFCCHKSRHYHDITIPCIKFGKMFLLEWNYWRGIFASVAWKAEQISRGGPCWTKQALFTFHWNFSNTATTSTSSPLSQSHRFALVFKKIFHCIVFSKSGTLPRKNFTRPPPPPFKIHFDSSTSSAAAQAPLGQLQASHTDTAGQLKKAEARNCPPHDALATTDCTRTARSCGARVLALAPSSSSARSVEHSEHSARLVAARCLWTALNRRPATELLPGFVRAASHKAPVLAAGSRHKLPLRTGS